MRMRTAFRGLIGRDHRKKQDAPEHPADRPQPVVEEPAIAEATVQEPAAQPSQPPVAASASATTAAAETESEIAVSENLWARAYRALAEREPELVKDYAKHVDAGGGDAPGVITNPDSVKALVKSLQDRREESQWKFSIRSKDHKVSDQLEKFIKLLALADGVVKQALSSQPYAALAWSTVSVFVPLLSGGFAQNLAMVEGFTTVGELQGYWKRYEEVYLQSASSEHYKNLAPPLSNVYSYMLEYQVRAVCHLSKKQLSRAWQKVAGANDWAAKAAHIVKLSDRCLTNIAPLQREEMVQSLAAQNEKLERIREAEDNILNAMKDHRQKDAEGEFLRALKSAAGNYKGGMEFNPDSVQGTCEWFFADEGFCSWRDAPDSGVFWLTAGPGCGKSVLARTLIKDDHLRTTTTTVDVGASTITTSKATVCFFFFKDEETQRTKITTALSALLHQLFSHEPTRNLIEHALPDFEGVGDALTNSFEDLWSVLATCAEKSTGGDIICVLDALDECNDHGRAQLIRKLDDFYDNSGPTFNTKVKFLITSRPYYDIETSFRPLSRGTQYFRFDADERHKEISHDIGLVIDAEMMHFAVDFDDADRQKIAETLKSKGTKTYLWLHLTLRIMKADPDQYSRRRDVDALLADVPAEISEAYEKILSKTKNERITSALLKILLSAFKPLTVEETNYALTLALEERGFETHAQLEAERWKVDFKAILKNFSGLLISVYDGKLSFIHLTATEYLMNEPESNSAVTKWGGRFADVSSVHALMARCCVQYLLLSEIASRALPLIWTDKYPLLDYAASFWPDHFREQGKEAQDQWIEQAMHLSSPSEPPLRVWAPIYRKSLDRFSSQMSFFGWTHLAVAAYLGFSNVVLRLLDDREVDVNETSAEFGCALNAALASNETEIAETLISRGADVNTVWKQAGTPLMHAFGAGNEEAVSFLLANGASPLLEFPLLHIDSTTVVYEAAIGDDTDIFRLLMSFVADISTPEKILAALKEENVVCCGKECVVRLITLLPDDMLQDDDLLRPDVLETMLRLNPCHETGLRLIAEQHRLHLLLEQPLLSAAMGRPGSRRLLCEALQKQGAPCANITKTMLTSAIEDRDPETVKILAQYCPEGIFEAHELFRAARYNILGNLAMYDAILEITGEALFNDIRVQEQLLEDADSPGAIYTFLRLPNSTPEVARCLMKRAVHIRAEDYDMNPGEYRSLLGRILSHSTERCDVIDLSMLKGAAREQDRDTVQMLLEAYSKYEPADKTALLEAAAGNNKHGKSVMLLLLQDADPGTTITPDVIAAAAGDDHDSLDWLMENYGHKLALTADVLLSSTDEQAFEAMTEWKEGEVSALAPQALQKAVEDRDHHSKVIQYLIPYCADLLAGASESFILSLLEIEDNELGDTCTRIVETIADELVLTERIVARAAAQPELLDLIQSWRPGNLNATPSLIAMVAASGRSESLDYLAKCDPAVTIGEEWYTLARFRRLLRGRRTTRAHMLREALGEGVMSQGIAEVTDAYGMTALHCAVYWENTEAVSFLLGETNVPVNAADIWGWTALHHAVRGTRPYLVQLLVDAGADPLKTDLQGRTPMTLAQGCSLRHSVCKNKIAMKTGELIAILNGDKRMNEDVIMSSFYD